MGSRQPNQKDPAGEMHAEIVRRKGREYRADQRRLASILHDRKWDEQRISEFLEIDRATVARLLAVNGHRLSTECGFDRHGGCLRDAWDDGRSEFAACECDCHPA